MHRDMSQPILLELSKDIKKSGKQVPSEITDIYSLSGEHRSRNQEQAHHDTDDSKPHGVVLHPPGDKGNKTSDFVQDEQYQELLQHLEQRTRDAHRKDSASSGSGTSVDTGSGVADMSSQSETGSHTSVGLQARRGPWSQEEDKKLLSLISAYGASNWVRISNLLVSRTPKQCRERYHQNLKPSLNRSPITAEEGELIERLVSKHGKKWAEIARHLNNRSDNAVKNWWNGGASRRRRASIQQTKVESDEHGSSVLQARVGGPSVHPAHQHSMLALGAPMPSQQQPMQYAIPQYLPLHFHHQQYYLQQAPPNMIAFNMDIFSEEKRANIPIGGSFASSSFASASSPYRVGFSRTPTTEQIKLPFQGSPMGTTGSSNLQSINSINTSLPSLILSSKRRLLDENSHRSQLHAMPERHSSISATGGTAPGAAFVEGIGTPTPHDWDSPVLPPAAVPDNSSRQNSGNQSDSQVLVSNSSSLTDSRRSSLDVEYFPHPIKDLNQLYHKRNISQNSSFGSPSITPKRFSVSSSSSFPGGSHHFTSSAPFTLASSAGSGSSQVNHLPQNNASTSQTASFESPLLHDSEATTGTVPHITHPHKSNSQPNTEETTDEDNESEEHSPNLQKSKTKISVSSLID